MKVGEGNSDGHNQTTTRLQGMTVRKRCLEIANALAAKEKSLDIPSEYKEPWENLEEIVEMKKRAMLRKGKGVSSQGGGG